LAVREHFKVIVEVVKKSLKNIVLFDVLKRSPVAAEKTEIRNRAGG
jgi:hypothetical protein